MRTIDDVGLRVTNGSQSELLRHVARVSGLLTKIFLNLRFSPTVAKTLTICQDDLFVSGYIQLGYFLLYCFVSDSNISAQYIVAIVFVHVKVKSFQQLSLLFNSNIFWPNIRFSRLRRWADEFNGPPHFRTNYGTVCALESCV